MSATTVLVKAVKQLLVSYPKLNGYYVAETCSFSDKTLQMEFVICYIVVTVATLGRLSCKKIMNVLGGFNHLGLCLV